MTPDHRSGVQSQMGGNPASHSGWGLVMASPPQLAENGFHLPALLVHLCSPVPACPGGWAPFPTLASFFSVFCFPSRSSSGPSLSLQLSVFSFLGLNIYQGQTLLKRVIIRRQASRPQERPRQPQVPPALVFCGSSPQTPFLSEIWARHVLHRNLPFFRQHRETIFPPQLSTGVCDLDGCTESPKPVSSPWLSLLGTFLR